MTYCVGIILDRGMILASDSRTHAGVDNFAKFCKMTVFERSGDRVLVLLSSGDLAGTQAVISVLKQRGDAEGAALNLWNARTMFDVANLVADAMRDIERRDSPYLAESDIRFNASFILGGQITGEPMRLFRIYAKATLSRRGSTRPFFRPVKQSTENRSSIASSPRPRLSPMLRNVCWFRSIRPIAVTCLSACPSI
jgi:putative proteasome-type protease